MASNKCSGCSCGKATCGDEYYEDQLEIEDFLEELDREIDEFLEEQERYEEE